MTLLKLFLISAGAFCVCAGLSYLIAPLDAAALTGMQLPTVDAVMDVQGFYGGQMLAIGLATLLALRLTWLVLPVLVMHATTLGGTAFGRVYGFIASGELSPLMGALLALEIVTALFALFLLRRQLLRAAG